MSPDKVQSVRRAELTGRGATVNPSGRFERVQRVGLEEEEAPGLHLPVLGAPEDRGELLVVDGDEGEDGEAGERAVATQVFRDRSRTVVNKVDSPDLPFGWTINPYRGCEHGCVYCYARPGHAYLGWSSGLDFETRLVAKMDAPALLEAWLARPAWTGEPIVMSGVTDPYQPVEKRLRISRGILEVAVRFAQPMSIITKSRLVLRDLDLLTELARMRAVHVAVSLTTLDPRLSALMEPRAASPAHRLETIARLRSAGVPVKVMTAPLIPGLNDHEVPALLHEAKQAGADGAGYVLLRLPEDLKEVFTEWCRERLPERAGRIESLVRQTRGGGLYNANFAQRHRGRGPVAEQIERMFGVFAQREGLSGRWVWDWPEGRSPFRRPEGVPAGEARGEEKGQMSLFGGG